MTSKYLVKLKAQRALLIIEKGLLPLLKSSFKIILDGKKKKKKLRKMRSVHVSFEELMKCFRE